MTPRDLPHQPLIRAALEKCGYTPEDVLNEPHWLSRRNPFTTSANRIDLPFLLFDADGGSVDWGRYNIELRFRRAKGGYSFSLFMKSEALPDATITGMTGKRLSEVIDVPGAESMTIALVKRDEDDLGYVLGLISDEVHQDAAFL